MLSLFQGFLTLKEAQKLFYAGEKYFVRTISLRKEKQILNVSKKIDFYAIRSSNNSVQV